MLIKEVCLENFTHLAQAIRQGAQRIELCDNLAVGGTTVSHGVLATSLRYAHEHDVPVFPIIRPRGGNFVYNDLELQIMENDLFQAQELGADGVVFGCLTAEGTLDEEAMEMLLGAATGMAVTFHMAFDALTPAARQPALDWLIEHNVDRILTHGGPANTPIAANYPHLQQLITAAAGRIQILPGGGITIQNATDVATALHVNEVHGTQIVGSFDA